jgi:ABC-2 type transport system permease protein
VNPRNIARLVYRNIMVNTDPASLVILIVLPAMYLIFFGYGFQSLIAPTGGESYLRFLSPGIMSFQTLIAGTFGGSMLWADRRFGMLTQLLVGPFTRLEYLLGLIITALIFGLVGAFLMLFVAFALLQSLSVTAVGASLMIGSITVGSILFGSIMLLISAYVESNTTYNSIQVLLLFFVNFASPVFYPYSSNLPVAIRVLFFVNPLTYIANMVRDGFLSTVGGADALQFATLTILTGLLLALSKRAYDVSLKSLS